MTESMNRLSQRNFLIYAKKRWRTRANQNRLNSNLMCIEDFSVVENVAVSLPLKRKKVITICDAPNGKILARKDTPERTPSLLKLERKSKKFLCLRLGQILQSIILKMKKWKLPKRKALLPKKREMSLWR